MNKIIVENDTMRFYSTPVPIPVGGSQWSKIFFMFSDEWEDLRKIAQFRQGELKINVDIDSNNFCYVPNEMLPDMCGELSIVGYPQDAASAVIATANGLMLNFVQGFESGGEPAVPPTPDLYQKLIKEFVEKQQSDWNQNDESAQDYIKNRTHWKEENTEKYEKLKLTSFLQDGRVHFYSLGGQIRFGGVPDLSVYPFSLRYGGDPIYSDKIPLTTLYLTSLAYTSCSGMSVYDEKEQLIGHFRFDALTFTAANDMCYTTVLLEVPYDYDVVYTVVLETKPIYHKIPQEYLPEIVLYSEQTLTEEQQAQARTNIGAFPAAVVPYFYKTGFVGVQYDARNAPAFSIIQEAGEDWKNEGHPPYTTIKEIEFPCIKTDSYMSFPGVGEFHLLDAAGVLWHCGIYVGVTSLPIFYLTKANASIVIHGTIDADDDTIIKLNERESQYILTQHRQVEIEVLAGQSKQRLVYFGFNNDSMLFFSCEPGVFIWGIWNPNERDVIRISQYSLNQVPLQPILRTWTD